jgi:hypothetical protein
LSPFPNLFAPTSAVVYRSLALSHIRPSTNSVPAKQHLIRQHEKVQSRAEITITPQAWLAARVAGLAPETTQYPASLANHLLLPAPSPNDQLNLGFTLKVSTCETFAVAPRTEHT